MVISKKSSNPKCNLVSKGQKIKQVTKFKYLGYLITSDGRCTSEISKRIAMAKDTFQKMKPILANRNISMTTKIRVIKTYVWSVLLYGSQCWTINKEIEKKTRSSRDVVHQKNDEDIMDRKKSNELLLKEANLERSLIKTIRQRQLKFLGHFCRHKVLEHLAITGRTEGKRSRDRQRITFIENLKSWAIGKGSNNNFIRLTENRFEWRNMIANVCSRQGTSTPALSTSAISTNSALSTRYISNSTLFLQQLYQHQHSLHQRYQQTVLSSPGTSQQLSVSIRDTNTSTLSIRDIDNSTLSTRDIDNSTLSIGDINKSTISHNRDIKNTNHVILKLHSVLKFHILSIPLTSPGIKSKDETNPVQYSTKMVRLSAQLINMSAQKHNPVRDWELDLRGYRIPVIENLGATLDQFDTIDFTDNDIRKLDQFPLLKRLKHILLSNNRIVRIAEDLQENLPSLETLVLINNSLKELSDIDPLSTITTLKNLSLLGNPVFTKKNYRLYVIYKIPSLKVLDFRKIKLRERETASKMFKKKKAQQPQQAAVENGAKAKTFTPGDKLTQSRHVPSGPSKTDVAAIRKAIANAKTLEEIEHLNQMLKTGQIPNQDATPSRPALGRARQKDSRRTDSRVRLAAAKPHPRQSYSLHAKTTLLREITRT
ncbi:U2 small nuclear ribonucleoprotein a'-like [Plakobranchus ocellatus]|uniref:U2 small nuclear ribonucleoprotein a'-like n=1 Tax=Plakobranchus ocellatus TaxID=259542 RepID=A0AAV3YXN6_9GAST|nr:U2 small nuclear ribonucleoprotein a'-like [Plakobranchus ocellatus]